MSDPTPIPDSVSSVESMRHGFAAGHVFVISNMVCAVAEVAVAISAVSKIHLWVCLVRDLTNRALMKVLGRFVRQLSELPFHVPVSAKNAVANVAGKEQQEIQH